ncbi:hypothetical protein ABZ918_32070 [Streptomyces viridosporus]|uniref:hypothetical protein n=1 Tax=Streptomyces viridosporus TaxID=67581 RepID=UPI00332DC393
MASWRGRAPVQRARADRLKSVGEVDSRERDDVGRDRAEAVGQEGAVHIGRPGLRGDPRREFQRAVRGALARVTVVEPVGQRGDDVRTEVEPEALREQSCGVSAESVRGAFSNEVRNRAVVTLKARQWPKPLRQLPRPSVGLGP